MNKQELITALADNTGMFKAAAGKFVEAFIDTVADALEKGDKVQIIGFGTFETRERNGRYATNPKTGEKVWVESKLSPAFKPGKALKDSINK